MPSVRPSGACVTVSASGSPALASRLTMASGRLGRELIPHGDTALEAGDVLVLLCEESKSHPVYEAVTAQCKR